MFSAGTVFLRQNLTSTDVKFYVYVWSQIKATQYDDINFRFQLCNKVVYPTNHCLYF